MINHATPGMTQTVNKAARIFITAAVLLAGLMVPATPAAHAITSNDSQCTLAGGNCTYYLQDDCDSTVGADTANVPLTGSALMEQAFNFYVQQMHLPGFQAAAIVGNFQQESSFNPKVVNGIGAVGIAQWYSDRRTELQSFAANIGTTETDFKTQLLFSQHELTTTRTSNLSDLKKTTDIVAATRIFEDDYEHAGATPDAPEVMIQRRIGYANFALSKYGKDAPDTAGTPTSAAGTNPDCASSATLTSAYGSQIVATALGLAWPKPDCVQTANGEHRASCADPTNAYRTAWDGASDYTDCGAFVASVMHASKADTAYPPVGTTIQAAYVRSHTGKYTIANAKSTAQLKPGDILIYPGAGGVSGHTEIYVGKQTGGYVTADASLGGHTPQLNTAGDVAWILAQPGAFVAVPAATTNNANTAVL